MTTLTDTCASFKHSGIRSSDILTNCENKEITAIWYVRNATTIRLAPTKEFNKILIKYKGY